MQYPMSNMGDQARAIAAEHHVVADKSDKPTRTLWGDAFKRLRKNKLAMFAVVWLAITILVAVTADLWVPQVLGDPTASDTATMAANSRLAPSLEHPFGTDTLGRDVLSRVIYGARISLTVGIVATGISTIIGNSRLAPSLEHPFGTDTLGRDVLSRVIYGARISLTVGIVATGISTIIGLVMGAIAAYYGGIWDTIIMRLADTFLAFPYTLFVIAMIAVIGNGIQNVFFAIGILGWPQIARVFRSAILSVKESDYIDAARAMGASDARIIARHIFPNSVASSVVYATMNRGGAIRTEAALSVLGMGVIPPDPSWGTLIQEGQKFLQTEPWLMILPGLAILTTVLAFTLLGDGLRDALDVKMKDA